MTVGADMPSAEPWQWCWQCGQALWDWSTAFESKSFLGNLVICRRCAKQLKDVTPTERRSGLIGYRDRMMWKTARGRGQ